MVLVFQYLRGLYSLFDFFNEWLKSSKDSDVFKSAITDTTKESCDTLRSYAESMVFSETQMVAFDEHFSTLTGDLFAVDPLTRGGP